MISLRGVVFEAGIEVGNQTLLDCDLLNGDGQATGIRRTGTFFYFFLSAVAKTWTIIHHCPGPDGGGLLSIIGIHYSGSSTQTEGPEEPMRSYCHRRRAAPRSAAAAIPAQVLDPEGHRRMAGRCRRNDR